MTFIDTDITKTSEDGFVLDGDFDELTVFDVRITTETGRGVYAFAFHNSLVNYGRINSNESTGVVIIGAESSLINDGDIIGVTALELGGGVRFFNSGNVVSIGNRSEVSAVADSFSTAAIRVEGTTEAPTIIENEGIISAEETAVLALAGAVELDNDGAILGDIDFMPKAADSLHNAGSILGDVLLGRGSDLYKGRGGVVHGEIHGGGGRDELIGGAKADFLFGDGGRDTIRGRGGDDVIVGGGGRDKMFGGRGDDAFVFADKKGSDKVIGFSVKDDVIWIENAVFKKVGPEGTLASDYFHVGRGAHDADDRVIYNEETGLLKVDRNGDADGGVTKVAWLPAGLDLTHSNIEIL